MIKKIKSFFRPKPTIWFTSDLHFGHRRVIEYCNRPYADIDAMTKGLIEIWNNTVKDGDTIYVLGDFSLNPKWSGTILPLLKGDKILIPGNHDACFKFPPKEDTTSAIEGSKRRHLKMRERYLSDGWKAIYQTHTFTLKNGRNVLLSHLPYAPKDGENFDQRYLNLRPENKGMFLLHGHLHCKYRKHFNMIDVGIDGDLKLWSEDEIISMIDDTRDIIDTPITEYYKNRVNDRTDMKGQDV